MSRHEHEPAVPPDHAPPGHVDALLAAPVGDQALDGIHVVGRDVGRPGPGQPVHQQLPPQPGSEPKQVGAVGGQLVRGLGREHRQVVAGRWMHEVFEPILALVPPEARGKLEPAEIFHEILVHRWYLSEQAGAEVDIFETAEDYIAHVLAAKPDEALTPPVPGLADLD